MNHREKYPWLYDVLFLLVFLLAGYLRLTGSNWGDNGGQHPDENHFSGVLESLRAQKCADPALGVEACPPDQRQWISLGDYFNSSTSTLNPYNRGYNFYVYGNLPMTIVRVAADAARDMQEPDDPPINLREFGRQFSALADLFAIFFLYLLVARLYDRRVALLAALFSALTVMQIQQAHFFTVDLFANTFAFLALWFAVAILEYKGQGIGNKEQGAGDKGQGIVGGEEEVASKEELGVAESSGEASEVDAQPAAVSAPQTSFSLNTSYFLLILRNPLFLLSLGFGFALGMAMASKINIAPLAIVLPGAFALRYLIQRKEEGHSPTTGSWKPTTDREAWTLIILCLVAGGLATLISFRIFQPYAFSGIGLNSQWVDNIREQRVQAKGDADLPWNLQWARRSHLFSFVNLTAWGLGLPLGILAWAGFLYMGWRILKGEWRHALLWGWTAFYFIWQSLQFNPTMRYQLPIYPLLVMMAAWFVFEIASGSLSDARWAGVRKYAIGVVGVAVVVLTAIWAFAFHTIYVRDEPRVAASRWIFQNVPGPINLEIQGGDSAYNQPVSFPTGGFVQAGQPYDMGFIAQSDGTLDNILLGHALNRLTGPSTLRLTLSNVPAPAPEQALATASLTSDFGARSDPRGDSYTLAFDKPVTITKDAQYYLRLEIDKGSLEIKGATVANETDYDYTLPLRVDGYDPFSGIYRGDLNLQVYWDDNLEKLNRFVTTLNETDYILIPTNHQYGQITRLPERYPLTTVYYRELIGCPEGKDIIWCYRVAEPGMFQGRLGYELVASFETYPKLGPIVINDQSAEEAFTFYDHPKVMIFKKDKDFDIAKVQSTLGGVDVTKAVHLLPRQFSTYSSLLLPADKLAKQRAGGTWSELFDYDWIQNRYPAVGLIFWYLFIFLLGLAVYPLTRLAMPGLADKGYPLSRLLGLVIFGYLAWVGGSIGIPSTRLTIAIIFGLLLVTGGLLAYYQRAELRAEWQGRRKYFLMIECLFLAFFLIDLLIRIGNPDLWHPYKGGERPMDFSYFNAVIKSTVFPPYDPWFAGGYINYYYYGFVLIATPVKLLGIVPSIAYNFILPTLFAIVGVCAFSLGWNLLAKDEDSSFKIQPSALIAGLSASALTILLGNLGTIQLVYQKLQELGAEGAFTWDKTISVIQRWTWAIHGFMLTLKGASLPLGPGEWYWNPSRVVPPGGGGNEITEFPLFTFLYSDLHAHMIAIPLALLALSWGLAVVAGRLQWRNRWSAALGLFVGGLIIGSFYPANLSDTYTYLLFGIVTVGYAVFRYVETPTLIKRIALAVGAVIALFLLSHYLYEPYRASYSQAYSALDPWKGPFTPIWSYLTHWLVFLFIVVSWMAWETREWMASTPVSALQKLKPYHLLIEGALVVFLLALVALQILGTSVGWIALPIAVWAAVLLLRPDLPDAKRFVLFLIGTALLITVVVEVVVVRGDIGRQNTIFKFYMEAWIMLAIAAGAAFAWTLPAFFKWLPGWRLFWQISMVLLISGAALFTLTGTAGKIRDRWVIEAPHSLDSMTFMAYSYYDDFGQRLELSEDYRAIRWMQDNVPGSPVIVETNCPEYHWCTRFTVYTGLPGVVGWNWHQRQQRAFIAPQVEARVADVGNFYNMVDVEYARQFLKTYDVSYIIVGQLEHAAYLPEGIAKFEQYNGQYWQSVYRDGNTVIYKVIR